MERIGNISQTRQSLSNENAKIGEDFKAAGIDGDLTTLLEKVLSATKTIGTD
jgi:hypothetical protein